MQDDSNTQAMRTIVVPKPVGWFIAGVFILFFMVLPGFLILYGVRQVIIGNASKTWPTAEGKVISSSVESHKSTTHSRRRRSTSTTFRADVRYQFTISGQTYSSNRVSSGDYGSSDPSHARSIANQYPAGSNVTVYYSPSSPETSVLEPGVTWSTYLWLVLGVPFACVGVAGIAAARIGSRWTAQQRDRIDHDSSAETMGRRV